MTVMTVIVTADAVMITTTNKKTLFDSPARRNVQESFLWEVFMYGLYIHVPFCLQKCKYCDFVSFAGCSVSEQEYQNLLIREMERYPKEKIDTIFVGGGTPTVCSPEFLERLFEAVRSHFSVFDHAEITVEANPKTLSWEKLSALKRAGVNRLSIGVQSFSDRELSALGRIHTAQEAEDTIRLVQQFGGFSVNLDFMTAIPYQTKQSLSETLDRALSLSPEHLSCYSLILEEGTPLYREYEKGALNLPEEDEERALYEMVCKRLKSAGYRHYEISNFAKPGAECRHNLKYWQCREYIGLGLAAHSYYQGKRFSNPASWERYRAGEQEVQEVLSQKDEIEEFMIMGFRLSDGISEKEFFRRFSVPVESVYQSQLEKFKKGGFLEHADGAWRLSEKGISVSNAILCEFLLDDVKKSN